MFGNGQDFQRHFVFFEGFFVVGFSWKNLRFRFHVGFERSSKLSIKLRCYLGGFKVWKGESMTSPKGQVPSSGTSFLEESKDQRFCDIVWDVLGTQSVQELGLNHHAQSQIDLPIMSLIQKNITIVDTFDVNIPYMTLVRVPGDTNSSGGCQVSLRRS